MSNDKDLAREVRVTDEIEQLRVQLAGCGVIAMCNTEESLATQMPEKGAYGWSASLAEVERAVRREIAMRAVSLPVAAKVPDAMKPHLCRETDDSEETARGEGYVDGWNACREAMLAQGNSGVKS